MKERKKKIRKQHKYAKQWTVYDLNSVFNYPTTTHTRSLHIFQYSTARANNNITVIFSFPLPHFQTIWASVYFSLKIQASMAISVTAAAINSLNSDRVMALASSSSSQMTSSLSSLQFPHHLRRFRVGDRGFNSRSQPRIRPLVKLFCFPSYTTSFTVCLCKWFLFVLDFFLCYSLLL